MADVSINPYTTNSYTCSADCQGVHLRCRGCGVLEGPDHFHRLREGYCHELLVQDGPNGPMSLVPITQSCWSQRERIAAYRSRLELIASLTPPPPQYWRRTG